jgi:hypothetical protein
MNSRALVETALRVLSAWNCGYAPLPRDTEILRQGAPPEWRVLPVDELAREIVSREAAQVMEDSRRERVHSAGVIAGIKETP